MKAYSTRLFCSGLRWHLLVLRGRLVVATDWQRNVLYFALRGEWYEALHRLGGRVLWLRPVIRPVLQHMAR
jgi:hypothetical protein